MNTGVSGSVTSSVDGSGEAFVDVLVGLPVVGAELRSHVDEMAERPETLVGEPVVVRRERRLLEPQPAQLIRRVFGRNRHLVRGIDDASIRRAGAMCDPHAAALPHQRVERDRNAAGGRLGDDRAVRVLAVQVRLAIGHDDQRTRRLRAELATARETVAEEQRAGYFVDQHQRDEQCLHLGAPPWKLQRDDRREPQRDPGLRDRPVHTYFTRSARCAPRARHPTCRAG